MNKKILMLLVSVLVVAMFAVPLAVAKPTNGQKTAVTVDMAQLTRDDGEVKLTGNELNEVVHVTSIQTYAITITFDDDSTLEGTFSAVRVCVNVIQDGEQRINMNDYYELDFPTKSGGFEGKAKVILDLGRHLSMAYGLFHGTGAFEGQTLNIGHGWLNFITEVNSWTGYWLKCSVYP